MPADYNVISKGDQTLGDKMDWTYFRQRSGGSYDARPCDAWRAPRLKLSVRFRAVWTPNFILRPSFLDFSFFVLSLIASLGE